MKSGKKISILGAGNVGASIAYTLTMDGMCSEIVLIDIAKDRAAGEAMDIIQGTPFSRSVNIYSGEYEDVKGSDIVIATLGMARKPGQTRIDLAQANVNIIKSVMPEVVKYAPDAIYVIVSNPVDILTYATLKVTGLPKNQVIGSGTLLDSSRLRSIIAEDVNLNPASIHAYVFGEHGDTSVVPWSLTNFGGMTMEEYGTSIGKSYTKEDLLQIEEDVRTSGAKVIKQKGATFYAIAMSVRHLCENILRDTNAVVTVSSLMEGEYGLHDVCLSIPFVVNANGISKSLTPPLLPEEQAELEKSANALKEVINSLDI